MMICGSCGMRMDGRAVLACKERREPIVDAGHVPVMSAMGHLRVLEGLVVDMAPFWGKIRSVKPWLDPGYDEVAEKERVVSQQQMNVIHKEALSIMCGCCVSECNSMESDPEFLGPAALAKGFRFVGDARDRDDIERLNALNEEHGIWDCTRCYFCNERCPKGVDPRDAIAKLGAESIKQGIDHDMGAKHAKWFVRSAGTTGWLWGTGLGPKTQGLVWAVKQTRFSVRLAKHGKVPPPIPPHVAKDVKESRALRDLLRDQGRAGAAGIVQGERGLARIEHTDKGGARRDAPEITPGEQPPPAEGWRGGRLLQRMPRVALGEGARHLDAGTCAEARPRPDRARIGHLLRSGRHPRGRARLLPPPERADPRVRRGDRGGDADDDLQRLHAQLASGEFSARQRPGASRARQRQPRDGRRPALRARRRGQASALADRAGRGVRAV